MTEPKACGEVGCLVAPVARGYCLDHLRGRYPAEWVTLAAATVRGREEPRLWTPPARPLTRQTSYGYEVIDFADLIGLPLLPWQKWLVVHALERNPDGSLRYRTVLVLVARQNGKTTVKRVVSLWRLYIAGARLVLGAAQDVSLAREVWQACIETIQSDPDLAEELDVVRRTNGDEWFRLVSGGRYKITASTRSAGRGLSVDELNIDELREQRDWAAWSALSKTTMARANGQNWAMSNAGDDQSVVLNQLRAAAGVELGPDGVSVMGTARDPSIFIAEWSAAEGCELDDLDGIAQANPAVGYTLSLQAVFSAMGTDPPNVYRTEVLCQKVDQLDGAIDLAGWRAGSDPSGSLEAVLDRAIPCVDVALDGQHVTLTAAAPLDNGLIRGEALAAWDSTDAAQAPLAELLDRRETRAVGWFSTGPGAALAPVMRNRANVVEITGSKVTEACQTLADLVRQRRVVHPDDPLLNAHIAAATKYQQGDGWRFARRGGVGHVDAAYSLAGAVYLALTHALPPAAGKPRIIRARSSSRSVRDQGDIAELSAG